MRVLLLDQFSEPGGAQRMLLDLLAAMRSRDWPAAVALPGDGPLFDSVRSLGFQALRIDCGPYRSRRKSVADLGRFATGIPRLAAQIRVLAAQFEPDLVYINGPRLLPAAALARLGKPVLFHAHIEVAQRPARLLGGISLRRLHAHVTAVCETVAAAWRPFVGEKNVSVIYNGVAGPESVGPRPHNATPRIGCIGRIAPEKGQREFLATAVKIHRALPDARFLTYGSPLFSDRAAHAYEREVREAAAGLPVEFAGWVTDVYAAMANLDLLLVPSVWAEPNPRVVLEAFAAGLPVIAFRAGGLPEIVEDGRTGFLCEDVDQMARLAIELLQGDRDRLQCVSAAARESWRRRFTLERWQQQILDEIERVAAG
jgi:glycosyltransferase involved in cell wall biosynthesis